MNANAIISNTIDNAAIVNSTTNNNEENIMNANTTTTQTLFLLPHFNPIQTAKLAVKAQSELARRNNKLMKAQKVQANYDLMIVKSQQKLAALEALSIKLQQKQAVLDAKAQKVQKVVDADAPVKNRYIIFGKLFNRLQSVISVENFIIRVDCQYLLAGGTLNIAEAKQTVTRGLQIMEAMGLCSIVDGNIHKVVVEHQFSIIETVEEMAVAA